MKLKFKTDAYYNGEVIYCSGLVHEVSDELGWAARWVKRGAEVVDDEPAALFKMEVEEEIIHEEHLESVDLDMSTVENDTTPVLKVRKFKSKTF